MQAARLGLGDDPYIREWHIHQDRQPASKGMLAKPIPAKGIVNLSKIGLIFCLWPVTRMLNNQ
jgi:hypothetical protein